MTQQQTIQFEAATGKFIGSMSVTGLVPGSYLVRIHVSHYLKKFIPGIVTVTQSQTINLSQIALVAGDVNNDNAINLLDYNLILDCYADLGQAPNCNETKKLAADITDDGFVNQFDYNLFIREYSVQTGI